MNKNMLYLLITGAVLVILALIAAPRHETVTSASPVNGMVGGTTREAAKTKTVAQPGTNPDTVSDAPAPADNLVPATARNRATDDVPPGAEVSGEAAPAVPASDTPKPVTDGNAPAPVPAQ